MSELYLLVTVADRQRLPRIVTLYRQRNVLSSFISLGHGTARGDWLTALGLDGSEKAVCFNVVTGELWARVKRDLEQKIRIDVPGVGVAFTIPLSSIGGRRELAFLTEGQNFSRGEETAMKGTNRELLVIISNQGFNDLVMDAAREAGAHGGTVIHARGTGMERSERFLGISLASEKDITLIVTRTERKNAIMKAVMEKAGMGSRAGSIVFSLPVTSTAGLRLLDASEDGADGVEGTDGGEGGDGASEGTAPPSGS